MEKFTDDLPVDEFQYFPLGINQRDLDIERAEDRRILNADDAGANHSQAARDLDDIENFIAVENAPPVERNVVRPKRRRANGDQKLIRDKAAATIIGTHLNFIETDEAR